MTTFYSTKYLFSSGIIERDGCELTDCGKYVTNHSLTVCGSVFERLGQEAFATRGGSGQASCHHVLREAASVEEAGGIGREASRGVDEGAGVS
jgi:hypothetical protein